LWRDILGRFVAATGLDPPPRRRLGEARFSSLGGICRSDVLRVTCTLTDLLTGLHLSKQQCPGRTWRSCWPAPCGRCGAGVPIAASRPSSGFWIPCASREGGWPRASFGVRPPDKAVSVPTRLRSVTGHGEALTLVVPVVFLVLPVTVLFALFPGLISIVSLAQ
jgi:hypothetical protein